MGQGPWVWRPALPRRWAISAAVPAARRWGNNGGRQWKGGRGPTASVNFVTAHDGFTLRDVVSYNEKHNEANGEDNRQGQQHPPAARDPFLCRALWPAGRRASAAGINSSKSSLMLYDETHTCDGLSCRDGETHNLTWNCGEEGESELPGVASLRQRQMRNFMAALLLAQGVPMLYMGDEYGHRCARGRGPRSAGGAGL